MSSTARDRPLDVATSPLAGEPESDLVERARRGDAGAYDELVRRYQTVAFRTAYLIVGGATEAEDAAQEAFVKAWAALGRFRPGAPLRPWLLRIVANEARNRRAAARRRPTLPLDWSDGADRAGTHLASQSSDSPEAGVLAEERRRELLVALDMLRDDDRAVIIYRYFLDLSESEMAVALGCARGTVKSRLSRALGRLRQHPSLVRTATSPDRMGPVEADDDRRSSTDH